MANLLRSARAIAVATALVCAMTVAVLAAPPGARITSLPGLQNQPTFAMYSGYVTVDATAGRNLFYLLVEAVHPTADTPLVLWMNGGPGCSSLLGFWTEHGPFQVQPDGQTLVPNPYSWNNVAHVLYLEAPAGVGFSYSLNGNYTTGDDATAADNYAFLLGFFQLYPEYRSAPFYVSGESYAGHYVPMLAQQIVNANVRGEPRINLIGVLAGNPSTDFATEANSKFEFMAAHAFLSPAQMQHLGSVCGDPLYPPRSPACADLLSLLSLQWRNVDPYNIYKWCGFAGPDPNGGCLTDRLLTAAAAAADAGPPPRRPFGQTFVPCADLTPQIKYLSSGAVRAALHVSAHALEWLPCSQVVRYVQYAPSMIPVYQDLLQAGLRALVYSGDVDSCVPYLGTQRAVAKIGLAPAEEWRAWNITDPIWNRPQTAGFTVLYEGGLLRYATVKGSGHMVPTDQPLAALEMLRRFTGGEPL